MTRELSTDITSILSNPTLLPFWAVDLEFDSPNDLYLWSGLGDLTLGTQVYTGAGNLLSISAIKETAEVRAVGASLALSGIPSDLLSLVLSEPYQGRKARIKFGVLGVAGSGGSILLESGDYLLTEAGDQLLLEAAAAGSTVYFDIFVGDMDQMPISEGPETSTISLSVESRLIQLEQSIGARYTSEDQKRNYPDDLAFDFLLELQTDQLMWGRKDESP